MEKKIAMRLVGVDLYQGKELILENVNIEIEKGEFLYIVGRTGTGKSSLLRILYGDIPLEKGEAEICGIDLRKLKKEDIPYLRRRLGIVFQDFKLLNDRNVYKNLEFVLKATGWERKADIKKRIEQVVEQVGMKGKEKAFPLQLSGGEQQRITIARALLNNPEIIIADEPTGNLDPETKVEVMDMLEEINKEGNTILMVTHDYGLVRRYPHRTMMCVDKKIEEVGI